MNTLTRSRSDRALEHATTAFTVGLVLFVAAAWPRGAAPPVTAGLFDLLADSQAPGATVAESVLGRFSPVVAGVATLGALAATVVALGPRLAPTVRLLLTTALVLFVAWGAYAGGWTAFGTALGVWGLVCVHRSIAEDDIFLLFTGGMLLSFGALFDPWALVWALLAALAAGIGVDTAATEPGQRAYQRVAEVLVVAFPAAFVALGWAAVRVLLLDGDLGAPPARFSTWGATFLAVALGLVAVGVVIGVRRGIAPRRLIAPALTLVAGALGVLAGPQMEPVVVIGALACLWVVMPRWRPRSPAERPREQVLADGPR